MRKELKKFLTKYKVKTYTKGELILCDREAPTSAYIIKKGIVKIFDLSAGGVEKPISFDVSNEVFPASWIFGISKRTHYFYEAFSDCQIFLVPRDDYLNFIQNNQELLVDQLYSYAYRHFNYELCAYAQSRAELSQKLLNMLYFLALRFSKTNQHDLTKTSVPIKDQDMALFVNEPLKIVRTELKKLEKNGVIAHRFGQYSINTTKLHLLLEESIDAG